jgi:hypothetical protein
MIQTIEDEENLKLNEMNVQFENLRETVKNKNVEELEQMKFALINKIEELDSEF